MQTVNIFNKFKESKEFSSIICNKINEEKYDCKFCYGNEINILLNKKYSSNFYDKKTIHKFFEELGAVEYKPETKLDTFKWVVMNNDIYKIYTFGEDDEYHITKIPEKTEKNNKFNNLLMNFLTDLKKD